MVDYFDLLLLWLVYWLCQNLFGEPILSHRGKCLIGSFPTFGGERIAEILTMAPSKMGFDRERLIRSGKSKHINDGLVMEELDYEPLPINKRSSLGTDNLMKFSFVLKIEVNWGIQTNFNQICYST